MSRLKDFMTDPTWYYTETVEIKIPGSCGTCMFFHQTKKESSKGICRRHSPSGISNWIEAGKGIKIEVKYLYVWPEVNATDWCGDGRLKEVKSEKG
jgi:hypothetical protein